MSRQNRIDFAGATHVVRINGRRGSDVFFDVSILRDSPGLWTQHVVGVAHLEYLLDEVCDEYSAPVHAYVIGPNFLELVMQTPAAPLEWVLRDLRARFAKFVRRQKGISAGSVYQGRYRAKVLDPSLLPFAMRRAHALPVYYGLVQCPGDYPFSSYRAYCGADAPRWLKREAVLDALQARGYMGVEGFRTFSNRPSSPHMTRLFEDGFTLNRKIIGTAVFAQFARQQAQQTRVAPSRDDLIERVALLLGASQDIVYRKTRAGALARALVAWYASRTGAASRTEVGRWFRVTGSALRHVIESHRRISPGLFDLGVNQLIKWADRPVTDSNLRCAEQASSGGHEVEALVPASPGAVYLRAPPDPIVRRQGGPSRLRNSS